VPDQQLPAQLGDRGVGGVPGDPRIRATLETGTWSSITAVNAHIPAVRVSRDRALATDRSRCRHTLPHRWHS